MNRWYIKVTFIDRISRKRRGIGPPFVKWIPTEMVFITDSSWEISIANGGLTTAAPTSSSDDKLSVIQVCNVWLPSSCTSNFYNVFLFMFNKLEQIITHTR